MKRLRRIIFNALTMISLVLCVGTVVLWVRSYHVRDHFYLIHMPDIPLATGESEPVAAMATFHEFT